MTRRLRFDERDKAALRALADDFTIGADGEVAVVAGEMEVAIIRPAEARLPA